MYSDVAGQIWTELKRFINAVDRDEAAEMLVNVLIDNDEDPDDIRHAFKHDSDVKKALTNYLDNDKSYEEEEEEYEEDYEEDEEDY